MAIKICDAIMGSGKTSAVIAMMNSNPNKKYLYITPLLSEADRIVKSCPELHFTTPSDKIPKYGFKKQTHLQELIKEGHNIAITHTLFKYSTQETISLMSGNNYTIIIDEVVDVLEPVNILDGDYTVLESAGLIVENESGDGTYSVAKKILNRSRYKDLSAFAESNKLAILQNDSESVYYWTLAKELFEISENTYILTYMFDSQILKWYFDLNKIEYEYIYINKDQYSNYSFTDKLSYIPAYVANLPSMIHIFENKKLNEIGHNKNALSCSWFDRALQNRKDGRIDKLKRNLSNYFRNYHSDIPSDERMWGSFKKATPKLRDKGYLRSDVEYNCKATNIYSHKRVLAYCVNIFLRPQEKIYFSQHSVNIDENGYALSVMLQWIWRSAIRDGQEIWIYIPSKRMRNLLQNWIEDTQKQYCELNQRKVA